MVTAAYDAFQEATSAQANFVGLPSAFVSALIVGEFTPTPGAWSLAWLKG